MPPRFVRVAVVANALHLANSRNVVQQACMLAARGAIHTVVKASLVELKILLKLQHVCSLPHEAAVWVLNGEEHAMFEANTAELLGEIVELIGC